MRPLNDWQSYAQHVNPTLARFLALTRRDQYFVQAQGNRLVATNGDVYTDWVAGFGALALGHRPGAVIEAPFVGTLLQ